VQQQVDGVQSLLAQADRLLDLAEKLVHKSLARIGVYH
jgi:hypothetical protein